MIHKDDVPLICYFHKEWQVRCTCHFDRCKSLFAGLVYFGMTHLAYFRKPQGKGLFWFYAYNVQRTLKRRKNVGASVSVSAL